MFMKKIDWLLIGGKIAEMRRSRDITQQQLAELTGLSDVYIGYLEQGKRHGTMDTYLLIVNVLGFTKMARVLTELPLRLNTKKSLIGWQKKPLSIMRTKERVWHYDDYC